MGPRFGNPDSNSSCTGYKCTASCGPKGGNRPHSTWAPRTETRHASALIRIDLSLLSLKLIRSGAPSVQPVERGEVSDRDEAMKMDDHAFVLETSLQHLLPLFRPDNRVGLRQHACRRPECQLARGRKQQAA